MNKNRSIIRPVMGVLVSAGIMAGAHGETLSEPRSHTMLADVGSAAVSGTLSVREGLPATFGGVIASTVSINAYDKTSDTLSHASGVKIGTDKVLTAGHMLYHLKGNYGDDPKPGYCETAPGLNIRVGFSDNKQGAEVYVTGVARSDDRDLAVLTVDRTPQFDQVPIAPVANLDGNSLPVIGKGVMVAGYPAHKNGHVRAQDPRLSNDDAHVYVWTGPLNPTDSYEATISLPEAIAGRGISGGPIMSGDKVMGVVRGGSISPGATGTLYIEHAVGIDILSNQTPSPVCS